MKKTNGRCWAACLLLIGIAGCSSSDHDSGSSKTYEYIENGCSTGTHEYSDLKDFCQKISDDSLNNGCAYFIRQQEFKDRCLPSSPPPVTPPIAPAPPTTTPAPVPPASQSSSCYNPSLLPAHGTEIPIGKIIDGTEGTYRLTSIQSMVLSRDGKKEMSLHLLATVETQKDTGRPNVTGTIGCKDVSLAPQGTLNGNIRTPLEIERESGIFSGGIESSFKLYGKQMGLSDRFDTNYQSLFNVPSLQTLIYQAHQNGQELHIYSINSSTIQMVTSVKSQSDGHMIETLSVAIYKFQPPPVSTPAPAPLPTPAPTPGLSTGLTNICKLFYQVDDQVECLMKFKEAQPPEEAIPLCAKFYQPDDKVSCLERLKGKTLANGVPEICDKYYQPSDKSDCLVKLADIPLSEGVISTCNKYYQTDDKVSCLLKLK